MEAAAGALEKGRGPAAPLPFPQTGNCGAKRSLSSIRKIGRRVFLFIADDHGRPLCGKAGGPFLGKRAVRNRIVNAGKVADAGKRAAPRLVAAGPSPPVPTLGAAERKSGKIATRCLRQRGTGEKQGLRNPKRTDEPMDMAEQEAAPGWAARRGPLCWARRFAGRVRRYTQECSEGLTQASSSGRRVIRPSAAERSCPVRQGR